MKSWADGRRSIEKRINAFSNYTAEIEHDGNTHTVHFMALFSEKKDAQSIIMTHGWPGKSPLPFLSVS
jgi:microsomal epoxide hydrolase